MEVPATDTYQQAVAASAYSQPSAYLGTGSVRCSGDCAEVLHLRLEVRSHLLRGLAAVASALEARAHLLQLRAEVRDLRETLFIQVQDSKDPA